MGTGQVVRWTSTRSGCQWARWMTEVTATVQNGQRSQLHALCYNLFCVFSPLYLYMHVFCISTSLDLLRVIQSCSHS